VKHVLPFAGRSNENRLIPIEKKFCVELAEGGGSSHYRDTEILGPGFLTALPPNTRLRQGMSPCLFSQYFLSCAEL
jgi:hypothetical protein